MRVHPGEQGGDLLSVPRRIVRPSDQRPLEKNPPSGFRAVLAAGGDEFVQRPAPARGHQRGALRLPINIAKPGSTYRARVRMKDNTGRYSRWSEPLQFTATPPAGAVVKPGT